MPIVPSLDPSQRVTSNIAPDTPVTSDVSAGLLDQGTTTQTGQLGDALGNASSALSQMAIDTQNRVNQTYVDDGMNQVQAAYYAQKAALFSKTGAAASTPDQNGVMPADAAQQQLNNTADTVRAGLTNPAQIREFNMRYAGLATQFQGEAIAHEVQQSKQYSLDTNNSTIQLAQNAAVQDYANPQMLDEHVQNAGNAAYKNTQVQGLQGPALVAAVQSTQSSVVRAAWQAAIANGDISTAAGIQQRYGSSLTADDAVHIDGTMHTAVDQQVGVAAARNAITSLQMQLSPAGQAFAANIKVESGGKQTNADGTPVTSSKGAVGIAQLLPATAQETAQKHGVTWDPNKFQTDPTYNASLGQMYWNDQLQANGGNMAKADAAYNAGPGALQSAISQANAAGTPNAWQSYLPQETQAYLQNVAAARQTGVGTSQLPTKAQLYAKVDNDPTITNPQARQFAYAQVDKLQDALVDQKKQVESEAQASALKAVFTNGGNIAAVDPATISNMNPTDLPGLIDSAKKARQGVDVTNGAIFQDIVTNMPKYAAMTDGQWYAAARPNLSEANFESLTKARAEMINNTSSNAPGSINLRAMNETLSQRLQSMGIDPYPAKTDTTNLERVGAIRQFVTQSLLDAQQQAGKKFQEADIEQHIDNLFTKSVTFTNQITAPFFGWKMSAPTTKTVSMMSMTANDIPDDVYASLKADFNAHGVSSPTNGQMLGAYWTMKTASQQHWGVLAGPQLAPQPAPTSTENQLYPYGFW